MFNKKQILSGLTVASFLMASVPAGAALMERELGQKESGKIVFHCNEEEPDKKKKEGEGSCGEGSCSDKKKKKKGEGSCGEGTCG